MGRMATIIDLGTKQPVGGVVPTELRTIAYGPELVSYADATDPALETMIVLAESIMFETHMIEAEIVWVDTNQPAHVVCGCCGNIHPAVEMMPTSSGAICGNCDGGEQPGCVKCARPVN